MVFNRVIGPARQQTGNSSPFIPKPDVRPKDGFILFGRKRPVLHLGRELVAPAQPARFSGPTWDGFANKRPVSWAVLFNKLLEHLIFFGAPWAFDPIHCCCYYYLWRFVYGWWKCGFI
ncbi:hypothetical protein HanRHA438_Chr15g0726621 [Helianthus annuus]|nr:hypothetical protein HanRHA438_Chr15g0726621 [Helianthus annuus]